MHLTFPLICIFLLIKPFCLVRARQKLPKTYGQIMDSLLYRDKLVFDISHTLSNLWRDEFSTDRYKDELEKVGGIRLSTVLYYGPDLIHFDESYFGSSGDAGSLSVASTLYEYFRVHPLPLYFLHNEHVNSTRPLTAESMKACHDSIGAEPEGQQHITVILNIQGWGSDLSPSLAKFLQSMLTWIKSNYANTKIGLEFDERSYKGSDQLPSLISDLLDVVIVDIHLPPETFLFSYSRFKRNLGGILDDNYGFIRKTLPNCTVYAKLDFRSDNENYPSRTILKLTPEQYQMYYFYLLQFSVYYLNEGGPGGGRNLILPTFNTTSESQIGFDGAPWRELVIADISPMIHSLPDTSTDGTCALNAVLEQVTSQFESISLRHQHLARMSTCILNNWTRPACSRTGTESKTCYEDRQRSNMLSSISLEYPSRSRQRVDNFEVTNIKIGLRGLPWKLLEIKMWDPKYSDSDLQNKILELPPNVKVACGHTYPTRSGRPLLWRDYTRKNYPALFPIYQNDSRCGPIWNRTAVIMWYIQYADDYDRPYDFTMGLETVRVKLEEFLKLHRDKVVVLDVDFHFPIAMDSHPVTYSLYCNPVNLQRYELLESFITFARFNGVPVKVRDVLGNVLNIAGGWTLLETVDELENKYLFFVARNYPEKFLLGEFHTDPCITWTGEVPPEGNRIDGEHVGVVLDMTGMKNDRRNLAQNELEMLLQFALHKFSLVEIIPGDNSDLTTLLGALSNPKFIKKLANQKSQQPKLYLRLNYGNFRNSPNSPNLGDMFRKLSSVALKLTGIHFQNWTNSSASELDHLATLRSGGILTGLSLADCVDEVRNEFPNLKKLFFINQVAPIDYILCNIEHPAEATNVDIYQTGKYLDTTLYIRKYFQRLFPEESVKVEILFRLNVKPVKSGMRTIKFGDKEYKSFLNSTGEFLKFFSDVSQYSTAYKMKLFMLPAFDDALGNRMGWWRISNFSSLTNSSNFVEREAEFLGRKFWRPTPEPEAPTNWGKFLILGTSVVITILVCVILLLRFWYRRQYPVLPKDEVDYFRFGKSDDKDMVFESRKFPEEFEIPRRRIILLNLIGQGNFGLVYKANLTMKGPSTESENISVAIKMPHPDCSRESFKSMLSELKVLAHIGSHRHVLEFVGAYTKEIGKGITYIATELCENGALEEYLRRLYSQLPNQTNGTKLARLKLALNRFAHEIALGMEFISSKNVVHGDLSTRNVLLDSNLVCKIGDFGLSRKIYDYKICMEQQPEGSLALPWRWLAIESLETLEFTTKSDIWSFGVTLWEIFSLGCIPYPEHKFDSEFVERLKNGFRLSSPTYSTEAIYVEMRRCWESNPEMRPSFTELAQFFKTNRDTDYVPVGIA